MLIGRRRFGEYSYSILLHMEIAAEVVDDVTAVLLEYEQDVRLIC
jgi:hypothetical protein